MSDSCGCSPDRRSSSEAPEPRTWWEVPNLRLAAVAGGLLLASFAASFFKLNGLEAAASWASLVAGAATFVPNTLGALWRGRIGVGTLMTIAAVGAVLLGEVREAATLAFLFSISEGLESYSLTRARRGLRALLDLVPKRATIVTDDGDREIAVNDLRAGHVLVVRPGDRVATDGLIVTGRSSLDNSAITGESIPVEASIGDQVYAGAINGRGALRVRATAGAEDNSLARIVAIVESEQARKGQAQRLADRIAKPLVPAVMGAAVIIAAAGWLLGDNTLMWIERALVVLVAASPCALAIAVPVSVVAAVGGASKNGILIKGGAALESLGAVRVVAMDKTGTLTRNDPKVIDIRPAAGSTRAEVLSVAGALEAHSEHPLARAILAAAPDVGPAENVEAVPGRGLSGTVSGTSARLGSAGWIEAGSMGGDVEDLQQSGASIVLVERDGRVLGVIGVRDDLRREAPAVLDDLGEAGYRVVMLTGDNALTATALGAEAGIEEIHADLLPQDKAALITQLRRGGRVAMIGDGVNDAPALATADVGIAMGAMGSDVAIETADVALMGEDLRHLPQALLHARRARRIMITNVVLSLAIIVGLMPLALFGVLGLAAVVLVHEVAEVIVIANGLRASRIASLPV